MSPVSPMYAVNLVEWHPSNQTSEVDAVVVSPTLP
jgi:hypothetical protein